MKIATYNVNGVNGRLPVLLRWLEQASPDIVCLQELKAPNEKFPEKAIRDLGYDAVWHGQKSWNGVAIPLAPDQWSDWLDPNVPAAQVLKYLPTGSLPVTRVFPPPPAETEPPALAL